MSLFKWIKGGSSQRRSRTSTDAQTQTPCFERLEDRVLLSADVSLVHDIQLLDTEVEQVISVDLEPGFGSGETQFDSLTVGQSDSETVGQLDGETVVQSDGLTVGQSDSRTVKPVCQCRN